MSEEVEFEPIPGLPEELPDGEHILWQGAPSWRALAREAFHVRGLAVYFGALCVLRALFTAAGGASAGEAVVAGLVMLPVAAAGLGLLALLAWLQARATIYTITNRRLVMRFGVAIRITLNLPFREVAEAGMRAYGSGHGDIPVTLMGPVRLAYAQLWPHARPWRFRRSQPMLRAVPEVERVSEILAQAWAQEVNPHLPEEATASPAPAPRDRAQPAFGRVPATAE